MKHLKRFNEGLNSNELEELKDLCDASLANLYDEDYTIHVFIDKWGFCQCCIKNYHLSLFHWDDVKDYYIPFLQLLSRRYQIGSFSDTETNHQVSFSGKRYYTVDQLINDEIGDVTTLGINVKVIDKI